MANLADDLIAGADGAAAYLGIPTRSIYHMVSAGHLPVIKKGRRLYFRKAELDQSFSSAA